MRPRDVDVPALVPNFAFGQPSVRVQLVKLSAFHDTLSVEGDSIGSMDLRTGIVYQHVNPAKVGLNFVERFMYRVILFDIYMKWRQSGVRSGEIRLRSFDGLLDLRGRAAADNNVVCSICVAERPHDLETNTSVCACNQNNFALGHDEKSSSVVN